MFWTDGDIFLWIERDQNGISCLFNALFYLLVLLFYLMRDVSDMSAFDDIHLEIEYFNVQIIDK